MKRSSTQILADATSALVQSDDVTHTLSTLLVDCGDALSAAAVGLLVRSEGGRVELLSSTSHAMAELELFQIQQDSGPCIDAISGEVEIMVVGSAAILERWPKVGRAIIDGGYHSVLATPLRWRGSTLGALNAFFVGSTPKTKAQVLLAQALADVATLVIVLAAEMSVDEVTERIRSALAGRIIIEQAKGVIAFQQSVELPVAYEVLRRTAQESRTSLTVAAERIVRGATRRPQPV